ncbi:MAG TPA: phosphoribosylformylglycinamidine synthase subunit PurQ, partial [Bacteroidia bacterium]|nr:phosphoribosylformylglycinamidine synthase subunit PurQ [Bacteroidia bacterium]
MSKFGVVVFPGSNCDQDMIYVLKDIMGQEVVSLWHKDTDLKGCDFIVLPGGFSYGDYLRSGAIARFSPIMEKVIEFANKGGYVLGVCNGFQILVEAGLLPGALLHNEDRKFICKNVYIKAEHNDALITSEVPLGKALKIPIAHGEGRFYADDETLKKLNANGQIIFRYCD